MWTSCRNIALLALVAATLAFLFTIPPPTPIVSVDAADSLTCTTMTSSTNLTVSLGAGITISNLKTDSTTQTTTKMAAAADAAAGSRETSVTTPGGTANAFTVASPATTPTKTPPPIITSVSPEKGNMEQTLDVIITGTNLTGATSVSFGPGVTVNRFKVDSAAQITASITINSAEATKKWDVSVTTPEGTGTIYGRVLIAEKASSPSTPIWIWVLIAFGVVLVGAIALYILKRDQRHLEPATELALSGGPTLVATDTPSVWGNPSTDAPPTGGAGTVLAHSEPTAPPPTIASLAPNHGAQGQTLGLIITGTDFTQATWISFGDGIAVDSQRVVGSALIMVDISIAGSAAAGPRAISVISPDGEDKLADGFTVTQASPDSTGTFNSESTAIQEDPLMQDDQDQPNWL